MAPKQKHRKSCLEAAAWAWAGKNKVFLLEPSPHDLECTTWTGGVNDVLLAQVAQEGTRSCGRLIWCLVTGIGSGGRIGITKIK